MAPTLKLGQQFARQRGTLLFRQITASRLVSTKASLQQAAVSEIAGATAPADAIFLNSGQFKGPVPRLNVLNNLYSPSYYESIAKIMKLREKYIRDRYVFVESDSMIPILKALGAKEEDFEPIKDIHNHLAKDPTLPFRESKSGRFCIDYGTQSIRRLEFQPFALSVAEDFKRYDSDQIRRFAEAEDDLQLNSVFQALMVFKALMFNGVATRPRDKLNYMTDKWICTLFILRTITTPSMLGEPALEGVHTDGVDHTMTTFLGAKNMAANSAASFMHYFGETTGIRQDDTKPCHLAGKVQHNRFLDTLLICDNERKHSISPVHTVDKDQNATRDMLIFFTRKPVTKGHISEKLDSVKSHPTKPMEIPLWTPHTNNRQ